MFLLKINEIPMCLFTQKIITFRKIAIINIIYILYSSKTIFKLVTYLYDIYSVFINKLNNSTAVSNTLQQDFVITELKYKGRIM